MVVKKSARDRAKEEIEEKVRRDTRVKVHHEQSQTGYQKAEVKRIQRTPPHRIITASESIGQNIPGSASDESAYALGAVSRRGADELGAAYPLVDRPFVSTYQPDTPYKSLKKIADMKKEGENIGYFAAMRHVKKRKSASYKGWFF